MKALTLTEPWASLLMLGEKNVETRSWRTEYRGPLAIHAAKSMPMSAKGFCYHVQVMAAFERHGFKPTFMLGHILCVRELIAIMPTTQCGHLSEKERCFGDYGPGRWAWHFSPVIKIITPPIAVKGSLSLWEWRQ
jgi:activating signal cointegrator 1